MHTEFALHRYRTVSQRTSTPEEVLLAVLEGVCDFVQRAKLAALARDIPAKAAAVDKALALLGELVNALDESLAPEVAPRLMSLYGYAQQQVVEGSARLDARAFDNASRVLSIIHATFREAVVVARAAG